jgi:hypothetical protein
MTAKNLNRVDDTVGATNSAPRNSIVDLYVYGFLFPGNYWRTLAELKEISEQKELKKGDMLKLKLLSTLLVEQLLGQGAVNSVRVLELMEEYIRFNKFKGD